MYARENDDNSEQPLTYMGGAFQLGPQEKKDRPAPELPVEGSLVLEMLSCCIILYKHFWHFVGTLEEL